jgi:hypothetical protein
LPVVVTRVADEKVESEGVGHKQDANCSSLNSKLLGRSVVLAEFEIHFQNVHELLAGQAAKGS